MLAKQNPPPARFSYLLQFLTRQLWPQKTKEHPQSALPQKQMRILRPKSNDKLSSSTETISSSLFHIHPPNKRETSPSQPICSQSSTFIRVAQSNSSQASRQMPRNQLKVSQREHPKKSTPSVLASSTTWFRSTLRMLRSSTDSSISIFQTQFSSRSSKQGADAECTYQCLRAANRATLSRHKGAADVHKS